MAIDPAVLARRDEILALAKRRGAHNVCVFGSHVRGESRQDSDLDLLVDLEPHRSLFDVGGLYSDLSKCLGIDVDVVTEPALHWYIQ